MKRTNSYLSAIVAIIIAVGCFWYSLAVLVPNIQSQNAKLDQAQSNVEQADSYLQDLIRSKSSIAELGDLPSLLSLAIPGDKDTPNLITELEAVAAKHKMVIPSIQVSDSATDEASDTASSNTVDVNFTVQGSFTDVSAFVAAIEGDIRYMNIQSITMTSIEGSSGNSSGSVSLSLQLQAYKRASAETAATGGGL